MIPISAFGLGTWQVSRKKWKENLINELKIKTTFPSIDFPEKFVEMFVKEFVILFYKFVTNFLVKMKLKTLNTVKLR